MELNLEGKPVIPTVKAKMISEDAYHPIRSTEGAACYDVFASQSVFLSCEEAKLVPTGLIFEVPSGYCMKIYPRSGLSKYTELVNSPGVVDSDYRGEVFIMLKARQGFGGHLINQGDRIAQIELTKVEEFKFSFVSEVSKTIRGARGFGSTGK